jgi:hypothetical protein
MQATISLLAERKEENSFLTFPLIGLIERSRCIEGSLIFRVRAVTANGKLTISTVENSPSPSLRKP